MPQDDEQIMNCPFCETLNIDGADFCEACSQPLTDIDPEAANKTSLEASIESDSLASLKPVAPVTVAPTDRIGDVIRLLADKNIGCVLVVWVDALVGIFSERDVLLKVGTRLEEVASEPVRHFMTPAPETLTAQDTIAFGLNRMAVGDFRHIPIEENEKPVGITSVTDVLGYLTQQFPEILSKSTS